MHLSSLALKSRKTSDGAAIGCNAAFNVAVVRHDGSREYK
jgi:hypothetical protein